MIGYRSSTPPRKEDRPPDGKINLVRQVKLGLVFSHSLMLGVLFSIFVVSGAANAQTLQNYPWPESSEVVIDSGPTGPTSDTSATFYFHIAPSIFDTTEFYCRLDGAGGLATWTPPTDFQPCEPPVTYTNLSDGPHLFEVAGNGCFFDTTSGGVHCRAAASTRYTWTVDTTLSSAPDADTDNVPDASDRVNR
jgi:hypothetical protein